MNRLELCIFAAGTSILAACTAPPAIVAYDVVSASKLAPTTSIRPKPRPVAAPRWPGCIKWPDDCGGDLPPSPAAQSAPTTPGNRGSAPGPGSRA
jgi:hypothetical protein